MSHTPSSNALVCTNGESSSRSPAPQQFGQSTKPLTPRQQFGIGAAARNAYEGNHEKFVKACYDDLVAIDKDLTNLEKKYAVIEKLLIILQADQRNLKEKSVKILTKCKSIEVSLPSSTCLLTGIEENLKQLRSLFLSIEDFGRWPSSADFTFCVEMAKNAKWRIEKLEGLIVTVRQDVNTTIQTVLYPMMEKTSLFNLLVERNGGSHEWALSAHEDNDEPRIGPEDVEELPIHVVASLINELETERRLSVLEDRSLAAEQSHQKLLNSLDILHEKLDTIKKYNEQSIRTTHAITNTASAEGFAAIEKFQQGLISTLASLDMKLGKHEVEEKVYRQSIHKSISAQGKAIESIQMFEADTMASLETKMGLMSQNKDDEEAQLTNAITELQHRSKVTEQLQRLDVENSGLLAKRLTELEDKITAQQRQILESHARIEGVLTALVFSNVIPDEEEETPHPGPDVAKDQFMAPKPLSKVRKVLSTFCQLIGFIVIMLFSISATLHALAHILILILESGIMGREE
jgi:hypothetical protein